MRFVDVDVDFVVRDGSDGCSGCGSRCCDSDCAASLECRLNVLPFAGRSGNSTVAVVVDELAFFGGLPLFAAGFLGGGMFPASDDLGISYSSPCPSTTAADDLAFLAGCDCDCGTALEKVNPSSSSS